MFNNLLSRVLANQTGGLSQPIEYPAGPAQNTSSGQAYLLDAINTGLKACPEQKYVLLGYSQGASLVLEASAKFSKDAIKAIKVVILVGNPYRFPGKKSNVDAQAQPDLRGTIGLFTTSALGSGSPVPQLPTSLDESGKVLDYCLEVGPPLPMRELCVLLTLHTRITSCALATWPTTAKFLQTTFLMV
jgi:pimeloyl-ACP methyl ester carboxylesterase